MRRMAATRAPRREGAIGTLEGDARRPEHPSLQRIGGFSDGVFAFAITLLILAIRIPHPSDSDSSQGLLALLTQQWRSYLAFVMSFMLIGLTWANHRVMFAKFARSDHVLVWLNLLLLMTGVAFMPIPTAVLGYWLGSANQHDQVVAAVFYGLGATAGALAFNIVWWYGAYVGRLTHAGHTRHQLRAHTIAWAPSIPVAAVLTAIAFISPALAVAGFVAMIVAYVLPIATFVAVKDRRHDLRRGR